MGNQATKTRDPSEQSRRDLRAMKSKVAAWVEEVRHERSLVGPGAHRVAYSRMLDRTETAEPEQDVFGSSRRAGPHASTSSARGPRPEPVEGRDGSRSSPQRPPEADELDPASVRARPHAAAPMAPRAPRKPASRAHGRSLFAFSALALVFAGGTGGYLMLESQHNQPVASHAVEQPQAAAVQVAAPPPKPSAPPVAVAQAFAAVKPLAPKVSVEKRASLALTRAEIVKQRVAPELAEPTQVASVTKPAPELVTEPTAQKASRPAPDPRAEALVADGKELIEVGDVAAARAFFERAAELGHVAALVELARTYDPVALKELDVVGLKPEPDKAIALYDKARAAGEDHPGLGLLGLSARLGQ